MTGATGFIGLALCRELLQNGYEVAAVIRPDSEKKNNLQNLQKENRSSGKSLRILEIPLEKINILHTGYHIEADFFFHLAWNGSAGASREDFNIQYSNIAYTACALRAAKACGCRKFIGAGSQAEYGVVNGMAFEDKTVPSPFMMYGAAKLAACQMGSVLAKQLGIGFIWPRIYSVYGVGENQGTLVNYVLDSLEKGEVPALSPCENSWNFLYITDCVRALRMLAEDENARGICHVASKDTRPLKEYVVEMRDLIAPELALGFGLKRADPERTFQLQPDVSKLGRIGFRAEVSFAEGVRKKMNDRNLQTKNDLEEVLHKAFQYAVQRKSFTKMGLLKQAENVCVYGLGRYFEEVFFLQNVQERFHVKYLSDRNESRLEELSGDSRTESLQLIHPEKLAQLKNVAVILMLGDPRSALEYLGGIVGLENCITYNDLVLDELMTCSKADEYYESSWDKLLQAFRLQSDEKSREIFVDIFCLRAAPHLARRSYEEMCTKPQYFPEDIISLRKCRNVVDCGAYTGDTLCEFEELTGGGYGHYYAFELDRRNFVRLQSQAEMFRGGEGITCFPYGVWSEDKDISYGTMASDDSLSIYNPRQTQKARVVSLDSQLKDAAVDFIKMDIEGAELEALKGCAGIIQIQHPTMAVCVYHRIEDMWEVPLYLKELCSDYKIYMRHHAQYWVSETVCYAVAD